MNPFFSHCETLGEIMTQEPKTNDDRVDEYALSVFKHMGYDPCKLPDSVVRYYHAMKSKKDIMQPGRLTSEGFAFVSVLADLTDGKLEAQKEEVK